MNPPRRLRGAFSICNLHEGFVNLREGFVEAPWRLREAFSKTRSAKASWSPLEGFVRPSRRVADSSKNDKPPVSRIQHHCATTSRRYMLNTVVVANTALVVRSIAKRLRGSRVVSCLLCFDCPTRLFPDVSCSSCNTGKQHLKIIHSRLTSNTLLWRKSELSLSFFSGGFSLSLMMC